MFMFRWPQLANCDCLIPWHLLNVSSLDVDLCHFRIFIQFLHFCRFANSEAVHVLFRWVCGWPCWVVLNTVLLLLVFVRWYSVFCTKWFGLDLVEQGKERKWKASMKLVPNSNWWRNPRKNLWFYKNGFNQMHRKIVKAI